MSAEHEQRPGREVLHPSAELEAVAAEQRERLQHNPEAAPEQAENRAESAREVIAKHEEEPAEPRAESSEPKQTKPLLDRALNYRHTLASLQRQLPAGARRFSKVIHNSVVENTSETLEKTIFRPSISLGATATAFVVGLFFYLTAHHYGYRLSGSEVIVSLVVGALIGLLFEGLISLFRRH